MTLTKETNPRKRFFSVLVGGMVLLLALVQIVISHRLAVAGEEVRSLETKAQSFKLENQNLEEQVSASGSLAKIDIKAQELGLFRAENILHLSSQIPVAYQPEP